MNIDDIRKLGLSEEALMELTGGADYIDLVRGSMLCPLCGMAETVWYAPKSGKYVCVDCHYVW